ncbi:MAG: MFS transporter, partial [Hyphomicrobiaceae bacterium]
AAFGLSVALQTAALAWFAMPWIRTFGKSLCRSFARPPKARGTSAGSGRPAFERPIFEACDGVDW